MSQLLKVKVTRITVKIQETKIRSLEQNFQMLNYINMVWGVV